MLKDKKEYSRIISQNTLHPLDLVKIDKLTSGKYNPRIVSRVKWHGRALEGESLKRLSNRLQTAYRAELEFNEIYDESTNDEQRYEAWGLYELGKVLDDNERIKRHGKPSDRALHRAANFENSKIDK